MKLSKFNELMLNRNYNVVCQKEESKFGFVSYDYLISVNDHYLMMIAVDVDESGNVTLAQIIKQGKVVSFRTWDINHKFFEIVDFAVHCSL